MGRRCDHRSPDDLAGARPVPPGARSEAGTGSPALVEKLLGEFFRLEVLQIAHLFTGSDELDRNSQPVINPDQGATASCAIDLRENEPGHARRLLELLRLPDRV